VIALLEIDPNIYLKNHTQHLLEILVELQLLMVWYFVAWAGFSFELCGDAK